MSTAGSARSRSEAPEYTPGAEPARTSPKKRSAGKRPPIFRWSGLLALLCFAAVACVGWILFGNLALKSALAEAATKSLGVEVDVGSLNLSLSGLSLDLRDVAVAHPFDSTMNVIEIRHARVELEGAPLLRKKIVIHDITVDSVRGLTHRSHAAKRVAAGGFLPGAMTEAKRWGAQFKVPILSLVPIDTIRSLILDPTQLQTVRMAKSIVTQADSVQLRAVERFRSIRLAETADSAQALLTRLRGQSPRTMGIAGTRTAIADVRRFAARVDSSKRALDAARVALRGDVDALVESTRALDQARQADYDFARGLLKLPTFDAPNIGPALFGQVSLDAFEKAMYWVALAREYAPPGLIPREDPGPKRLRRSGTTIHFVQQASMPRLHLRRAALNLVLDANAGPMRGTYALRIADVTTDPAIVGKPTVFSLTREARGAGLDSLLVVGTLDHTHARQTETIVMRAGGIALPKFALPSVPLRLDLGRGSTNLRFNVVGDSVAGRLIVTSPHPAWSPDSARRRSMNTLETLVSRVLTGIDNVDMTADIRGTTKAPTLLVRSNLDRAVADNIKRVAGEEISKAEAKARAQVDAFVERETAPLKEKVEQTRADIDQKIADANAKLDKAKADLAARLKELSAGVLGG